MGKEKEEPDVLEALGYVKTDAMSNLEAKRGCTWANRLIVSTIEAVEHFETVKGFYYKEERVEFKNLFSAFLERKGGCLDLWQTACCACIAEKTPPNADEADALYFAGGVLWQDFLRTFGYSEWTLSIYDCTGVAIHMKEVFENDGKKNRKALKESILNHTFNLAETCYRLRVLEWKTWYEHRDWPIDWAEWDTNGPVDGRGAVEAIYPALKDFDKKNANAFEMLRVGTNGIHGASDDFPRAFVYRDSAKEPARSFEAEVRAILTMETSFVFKYPDDLAAAIGVGEEFFVPSNFLMKRRHMFVVLLYARIAANAKKAPSDASRRLWIEAEAELLQNITLRHQTYAKADADRIIELANRAQRESWIERKMKQAKKGGKTEEMDFATASAELEPAKLTRNDLKEMEEKFMVQVRGYVDGRFDALKKRKRGKGGRKGSTTRGRQTPVMIDQFAALQDYLDRNHVPRNCSYAALKNWINSFWNEHQKEYEKVATANGDKKGYGSVAMMFRAAKKKGYGQ